MTAPKDNWTKFAKLFTHIKDGFRRSDPTS